MIVLHLFDELPHFPAQDLVNVFRSKKEALWSETMTFLVEEEQVEMGKGGREVGGEEGETGEEVFMLEFLIKKK